MNANSILPEYNKKALLIINPVSGKKQVLKYIPYIIRRLMDSGYVVTTAVTARRGEAVELSASMGSSYDLVCCTGGDGTLNETLTGLARENIQVPLGYIPCGSTNDFAMSHGLATDIAKAADNMASGPRNLYDIGHFGSAYFSYVAAFGAFSWLSYTTDQNLKNVLGHTAYIIDGIKDVHKLRPYHVKFTAGGKIYEDDYIFGAICNSTSVAGTIELPKTIVNTSDGIFEVLLVKTPKSIVELETVIRSIVNQDYASPLIDFFQVQRMTVECEHGTEWALDGERMNPGTDAINFNVIPKFLDLQG